MHAIRLHAFGPPENLVYEEVEDPQPGPGQVRIAVAAAGVHLIDTTIRAGVQRGPMPLPDLPAIPGREVAGTVDALGPGVAEEWLGRRVVAHLGPASGGYAELAVRDVDAVHPIPDGAGEDEAVAMIGTGRTTLAILEVAQLVPGDVALITSAAGGIGALLIQAARAAGTVAVGLAGGGAKLARVRDLGAEVAIDYTERDWPGAVREALGDRAPTVAFDGVGGEVGRSVLELLAPGGRLILFGFSSGELTRLSAGDLFGRGLTASAAIGPRIPEPPGRDARPRGAGAGRPGRAPPGRARAALRARRRRRRPRGARIARDGRQGRPPALKGGGRPAVEGTGSTI
jgi:NADPH:quinone reductase